MINFTHRGRNCMKNNNIDILNLVKMLPVEDNGIAWLDHAIFSKDGQLDERNFKYNSINGKVNIVRVINKIGKDYAELLDRYKQLSNRFRDKIIYNSDDTNVEKSKLIYTYCVDNINQLERFISRIAKFVLKYYKREAGKIRFEMLSRDLSLIQRLTLKYDFKRILKDYRLDYNIEIKSAFERLAKKTDAEQNV